MNTRGGYALLALFSLTSGAAANSAVAAEPAPFAPHRAIYDLTLGDSKSGSDITGVTGRMVYELSGSPCDGYSQTMRFVTVMTNQDGTDTVSDLTDSSWEEADARKLRFSSSEYQDDQLAEASQGDALRSKGATPVVGVDLVKPAKKSVSLPADIYFPMQHALTVVQAAKRGEKMFTANLFNGAEKGEKYFLTNTIIGNKFALGSNASLGSSKGVEKLAGVESWPLTISYFYADRDHQDQTPVYVLSYRYFENGVTSDLTIDYGGFSIKGALKELTFLPAGKCESKVAR